VDVTVRTPPSVDPLVVVDDTVTATAGVAAVFPVLDNDSGTDLTVSAVTAPGHGTAAVNADGTGVGYTPSVSYSGGDSFGYTVTDAAGNTATGTVSVTVTAAGSLTAGPDTGTVSAGGQTTVDVLDNDSGQGTLQIQSYSQGDHGGVVALDNGVLVYQPAAGFYGTEQFTYTLVDGLGRTATGTVTVTVNPAALAAVADSAHAGHLHPAVIDVLANDTGAGTLAVSDVDNGAHGTTAIAGGVVEYTPDRDHWGSDTFTYTLTDALGRTGTGTVTVTVDQADAPVDDTVTVAWNGSATIDVLDNDPNGSTLAEVVDVAAHGTATVDGSGIAYVPAGDHAGTDSFTYRLAGSPETATVTVTVSGPGLTAIDDTLTVPTAGVAATVNVLGNDSGSGLTVTAVGTPGEGSSSIVDANGGTVRYTAHPGVKGDDSFTYTVTDAVGNTATATVDVSVANAAPAIVPVGTRYATAGGVVTVPVTISDPNGDTLTVTVGQFHGTPGATRAVVGTVIDNNKLRLTIGRTFSGHAVATVVVGDGEATASTTIRLLVSPLAPTGLSAGVLGNPEARKLLAQPTFVDGRPVSRTLSERVDSTVTWAPSPTTSVVSYRVVVNGRQVCAVTARPTASLSCVVRGMALDPADAVRVIAIGADGFASTPATVRVSTPSSARHLLAVVYFPVGKFNLDPTAQRVLARVAQEAKQFGFTTAVMVGHTDADGSTASNLTLSRNRSQQVARYMAARYPGLRLATAGHGESQPALPNSNARNKAANRRVEIYVG
jgi:outer membrane protein OmpA-like peptidoglycan-associated protein